MSAAKVGPTPGSWRAMPIAASRKDDELHGIEIVGADESHIAIAGPANAALIARAPELAEEVERLRERVARLRRMITPGSYLDWAKAGGPNECPHGYARGIPCFRCDSAAEADAVAADCARKP